MVYHSHPVVEGLWWMKPEEKKELKKWVDESTKK